MTCSELTDNWIKVFGPLTFKDSKDQEESKNWGTVCLLCSDVFNLHLGFELFLKHIFEVHNLVIEDVQNIQSLNEYITYWKQRFSEVPIDRIIPSVAIDSTEHKYFLLSVLTKEDKNLRHKLRLEHMLKVQEFERTDRFYTKACLFCKLNFEGIRSDFINHLSIEHNLQLGNPQNLVYIDELIDKLSEKLTALLCIYCEKTFPDRSILKEHMRKKLHKRINPQNLAYDKYYSVNYLEPDRTWHSIDKEPDNLPLECNPNSDEEYGDWEGKVDSIVCLFCAHQDLDINKVCQHMLLNHNFDFHTLTNELNFYQKVKLVNYTRRQIHNARCLYCDRVCHNVTELLEHMQEEKHFSLPDLKMFDQTEFYFPTYENDAFLYFLEEIED